MTFAPRVLDASPVGSLDEWVAAGGRAGLDAARATEPGAVIETLLDSGLRGRGGAGFPTGLKWRSVAENLSSEIPATVVVNGAEGEPGSFKDRAILLANPYRVIEGALIAAATIGASRVVVAIKANTPGLVERVQTAADEINRADWLPDVTVDVIAGPGHYLYGEETALLEVVNGRQPFPRIAPPWRRGADDLGDHTALSADIEMAGGTEATETPPALVNNVETLANVPAIIVNGPEWFRSIGTDRSPGSMVVTVSGRTVRDGVAEVAMGTTLGEVIQQVGGGVRTGSVTAILPGVSNPILGPDHLDTALTYEAMAAAGTGLGAGAYLVFDSSSDPVAVAQGVSRFLAVESCGQCSPCKDDGKEVSVILDRLRRHDSESEDLVELDRRLGTITDGARCFLATQHQMVVQSLLALFPDDVIGDVDARGGQTEPAAPVLIAEIVDIAADRAVLDESQATKQPDWTFDAEDSGAAPADRLDQRSGLA